jgi:hypothetical protein
MTEMMKILSLLVLFTTIATLVFAVGAYIAFKLKESRRPLAAKHPKRARADQEDFLQQYVPKDKE